MELPLLDARLHRCRTLPPESVTRISASRDKCQDCSHAIRNRPSSLDSPIRRYRGKIYNMVLGWVSVYVHRFFASLDPLHLFHKELAVEDDPSIGRPKMLQDRKSTRLNSS